MLFKIIYYFLSIVSKHGFGSGWEIRANSIQQVFILF